MRFLLLSFVFSCFYGLSQQCVDSSLIDPSAICPGVFDPVCGCDGNTYENACVAQNVGGVTNYTPGPCPFPDSCRIIPLGVDFGTCDLPIGWANYGAGCVMVSGCSVIGSDGNDYTAYFFTSSYACNSMCLSDTTVVLPCIDTSLIDLNVQIPNIYQPVCGCDSVTYQNLSEAMYHHGIVSYVDGECPMNGTEMNTIESVSLYPNPFQDIIFVRGEFTGKLTITILTIEGRFVEKYSFDEPGTHVIDTHLLPTGTYVLVVKDEFSQVVRKLVKK